MLANHQGLKGVPDGDWFCQWCQENMNLEIDDSQTVSSLVAPKMSSPSSTGSGSPSYRGRGGTIGCKKRGDPKQWTDADLKCEHRLIDFALAQTATSRSSSFSPSFPLQRESDVMYVGESVDQEPKWGCEAGAAGGGGRHVGSGPGSGQRRRRQSTRVSDREAVMRATNAEEDEALRCPQCGILCVDLEAFQVRIAHTVDHCWMWLLRNKRLRGDL